jgi:hypothetical protein
MAQFADSPQMQVRIYLTTLTSQQAAILMATPYHPEVSQVHIQPA